MEAQLSQLFPSRSIRLNNQPNIINTFHTHTLRPEAAVFVPKAQRSWTANSATHPRINREDSGYNSLAESDSCRARLALVILPPTTLWLTTLVFSCNCISIQLPLYFVSAAMVYRRRLRRRHCHQPFATHSMYRVVNQSTRLQYWVELGAKTQSIQPTESSLAWQFNQFRGSDWVELIEEYWSFDII